MAKSTSQTSIPAFTPEEKELVEKAQKLSRNKGSFGPWVAECALKYCELIIGGSEDAEVKDAIADAHNAVMDLSVDVSRMEKRVLWELSKLTDPNRHVEGWEQPPE